MTATDHPGIYIPPPLIYAAFFFFSLLLQKFWPIEGSMLHSSLAHILGTLLILLHVLIVFPALWKFLKTHNTLMTIRPAHTLQTTGIYAHTRNPMYLALLLLYGGIAFWVGNWWTLILMPFIILTIQRYVIKREEHYLHRAFGEAYEIYKKRVRRWI